jgi:hypothetical protein
MVIRAHTEDGAPIQVSFPSWFTWLAGIVATLVTMTVVGTAAKLVDIETRVTAMEAVQVTPDDMRGFVSVREYDATILTIQTQLARIESKIDRLQEQR